ncbi:MAG: integrase [Phycisphaeraceae bacterium]|nr:integrase [Phycisphaeraceae bacterium]
MASITKQANGRRLIQFTDPSGSRKSLRLGKVTQRAAEATKVRVENLISAAMTSHALDDETARWVANLDVVMAEKLAAVGLIAPQEKLKLKAFLDGYTQSRSDTKPSTQLVYGHTKRNLIEFFGPDKVLRDITAGDADEWRLYLTKQKLAENTIRRRSGIAKQFFNAAVRKELMQTNPFAGLKSQVQSNPAKMYFVTKQQAQAILNACPDARWQLIFALSRFGGLRCPSETLSLRWGDVDWEHSKIKVRSPKTEHHPGGEWRMIPMFPELVPYLQEVYEMADPDAKYVVARHGDTKDNLRTHMSRIIGKAGIKPWPKLFQNLRSTRETELAETYPLHVVCAWIGNSQPVATKHYLQVTDEHFASAARESGALQNAMQHPAATPRIALHRQFG